jgi:uncharacterized hydrophobic protein (TIGR00271 family)
MSLAILLLDEESIRSLPTAMRIASASGQACALLIARAAKDQGLEERAAKDAGHPPLVQAAIDALVAAALPVPAILDCRGPSVERAIIEALTRRGSRRVILAARLAERAQSAALVRRLVRILPLDLLVVDASASPEPPRRILVAQIGGGGGRALRDAAGSIGGGALPVVAIPDGAALARSRRVQASALERMGEERRRLVTQADGERPVAEGVARELAPSDLILVEVADLRELGPALSLLARLAKDERHPAFAAALLRPEDAVGPGRFARLVERVRLHAPALDRDGRRDVLQLLERGGSVSADFLVMLVLSAAIAAFGLVQSSTGVVIGAMLVAPLMTPLVAIAAALVQGNLQLARSGVRAVAIGVTGALLASAAIGLLSPWPELSSEILARGSPNPFDLGIALLSGMAAAYALARPGVAGTLVGVAIAVALVPPLASVGIALVKGYGGVAFGAATLFLTNLIAIILGAVVVFRFFGLDAARRGASTPRWAMATIAALLLALLPIGAMLAENLIDQTDHGVQRQLLHAPPKSVRQAIGERLARESGVAIVALTESDPEFGPVRELVVACESAVPPSLRADLERILKEGVEDEGEVRVLFVRALSP